MTGAQTETSLRDRIRAARSYLKSWPLFRAQLHDPAKALILPFRERLRFHPRSGAEAIEVPGACWTMLPSACRLLAIGALPSWEEDALKVRFRDRVFYAPALDKSLGTSLAEIFVEDVYRLNELDLAGATVLDVGAYIGDSAVAFAARGAFVHAFEPAPITRAFLERTIAANHLAERVRIHPVGLSDRDATLTVEANLSGLAGVTALPVEKRARSRALRIPLELKLVEARAYLASCGIGSADVLKLDCEGCEYALLGDGALLEALAPARVILEYHRGGAPLARVLERHGYRVRWLDRDAAQGYMEALRGR